MKKLDCRDFIKKSTLTAAAFGSTNSVKSFFEEYILLDTEGFSFCPKMHFFRVPAFSFIYGLSSITFIQFLS